MKKIFLLFIAITAIGSNAYSQKKIKGNGILGTETRKTVSYDQITLIGSPDVELVDGIEGNLVISGETNILPYIETQVVNNELVIKFKEKFNYTSKKPLKVIVPVKDINSITIKGSGDIVGKNNFSLKNIDIKIIGSGDLTLQLDSESIDAQVIGSGDIKLSGKTQKFKAYVKGSGDIIAKDLQSKTSSLSVNGSGDISSTTTNQLDASVFGSGDINVYGSPSKISKQVKGSGDISIK